MQNLFILSSKHSYHLPILILLLLCRLLTTPTLRLQLNHLILAPTQLLNIFVYTTLSLLHQTTIFIFFGSYRRNLFLNLTPKLYILLPKRYKLYQTPQSLLVIWSIRKFSQRQPPGSKHWSRVCPLLGEPVILVLGYPSIVRVEKSVVMIVVCVDLWMRSPVHIWI